ncbi:MAG TPA: substrate-binding domain-containing protein [Longimicrobiales bacterium]
MRRTALLLAAALVACGGGDDAPRTEIVVATTTSVEDTGLLELLAPALREELPDYRVSFVAVGSGQALALARRGDADVVFVHDPDAEQRFVAEGHGDRRRTIMRNDFVVIGPPSDPARVREAATTADAFRRIAAAGALFLSRGDSSGTHRKEIALWRDAGVVPDGAWYREAGVGQGDLVRMASERAAYALTDRGTYRFHEAGLELDVVHADQPPLENVYSVIVASRARDARGARAVADWLAGPRARALIRSHGTERFGSPLFDVIE